MIFLDGEPVACLIRHFGGFVSRFELCCHLLLLVTGIPSPDKRGTLAHRRVRDRTVLGRAGGSRLETRGSQPVWSGRAESRTPPSDDSALQIQDWCLQRCRRQPARGGGRLRCFGGGRRTPAAFHRDHLRKLQLRSFGDRTNWWRLVAGSVFSAYPSLSRWLLPTSMSRSESRANRSRLFISIAPVAAPLTD